MQIRADWISRKTYVENVKERIEKKKRKKEVALMRVKVAFFLSTQKWKLVK